MGLDDLTLRLFEAIAEGDKKEVERLIKRGAKVNAKLPDNGISPLHAAIILAKANVGLCQEYMVKEYEKIADVLLKNGAKPLSFDKDGLSTFHYAVVTPGILRLLLNYYNGSVDIYDKKERYETPLCRAVKVLRQSKMSQNECVYKNVLKSIKLLLDRGANPNDSCIGMKMIYLLIRFPKTFERLFKTLKRYGFDINSIKTSLGTPMLDVYKSGIRILFSHLQKDAELDVYNEKLSRFINIVYLLNKHGIDVGMYIRAYNVKKSKTNQ